MVLFAWFPGFYPGLYSRGHSGRRRAGGRLAASGRCTSDSRRFTPGFIPAASQAAGERAIDWRSHPCVPAGLRLSASSGWWKTGTQSVQDGIPTGTVGTSAGPLRTGRSASLCVVRVVEDGNAERSGRHSHGDRGNECWRVVARPSARTSEHIAFTSSHVRITLTIPGLHSRGLSGRRRAGVSVADFPRLHLGFTGFHLRIPGILPGLHSRGLSGRRRCAAVSGSRGFSPGFIPAAIQAAGERAIDWRSPGVAHPILGVSSPNPGDSPRASFPRPVRPQESGRFGGRFPGLHLGFPGILPGLHSSGLSGRRRCAAVSGSRGFSPGFIPAAIQAAGELKRSFELPGREMGDRLRCRFGPRRG